MTVHTTIQSELQGMGPKERVARVFDLAQKARLDERIFEDETQDEKGRDAAVERYSIACDQIVKELGLLIDTGVTEEVMNCLDVVYGGR